MPISLAAIPITPENFHPYGQMITAIDDHHQSHDPQNHDSLDNPEAQLNLKQGTPRFYIMRLQHRGQVFSRITRHLNSTQSLGSLAGQNWLLAVAPPGEATVPELEEIVAFQIPGNCFVNLAVGTWHAGPYFLQDQMDFYNLELSDTNIVDHHTCNLKATYGVEFEFTYDSPVIY